LLEDLAAATNGRVLSLDRVPADLFNNASGYKELKTSLWPYFILAFLLLLIADVATRKLIDFSVAA
jgi:hypothetical protein